MNWKSKMCFLLALSIFIALINPTYAEERAIDSDFYQVDSNSSVIHHGPGFDEVKIRIASKSGSIPVPHNNSTNLIQLVQDAMIDGSFIQMKVPAVVFITESYDRFKINNPSSLEYTHVSHSLLVLFRVIISTNAP